MSNLLTIIGIISTTLVSIWAVSKYIITVNYKLDNNFSKKIIDKIEKEKLPKWIINKNHTIDPKYPDVYEAFTFLEGVPIFFSRGERLLTAGWKSKEEISYIVFPRWSKETIDNYLISENAIQDCIPVMSLSPSGPDKLGELAYDPNCETFLSPEYYQDIEDDVKKVLNNQKNKTGALLYGKPGNGKSQFAKYLSRKYSLPIYVVYLHPDYSNLDIALMFSSVPNRSIVLMEDFDNYFHGRECAMKNESVKFTFDAFINALDGVHNDYRNVVFIMTANDISKIDDSIKSRPSRLKFVREFGPPNKDIRMKILNNTELVAQTEGLSLDKVFSYKID